MEKSIAQHILESSFKDILPAIKTATQEAISIQHDIEGECTLFIFNDHSTLKIDDMAAEWVVGELYMDTYIDEFTLYA